MNTQSSVQSWAIASRLFLASRSPNTSWRLRLMRVSIVSGMALSHSIVERFFVPYAPIPVPVAMSRGEPTVGPPASPIGCFSQSKTTPETHRAPAALREVANPENDADDHPLGD